ncbi:hypothetical protein [Deinococcus radiophilus]|uniref:hypothetical protein n=1 Tax=Deinococcus radiophilus TaxID=32062 RepID=UPI003620D28C
MSDPIRVDWVVTALWPGRLGLTFAPGKKGPVRCNPASSMTATSLKTSVPCAVRA